MAVELLSPDEQWVLRQAVSAIARGELLSDDALTERIGADRDEVDALLARWPRVDDTRRDAPAGFIINNCLNEVCYGLDISDAEWNRWFDVSRERAAMVYRRWARLKGWSESGTR